MSSNTELRRGATIPFLLSRLCTSATAFKMQEGNTKPNHPVPSIILSRCEFSFSAFSAFSDMLRKTRMINQKCPKCLL